MSSSSVDTQLAIELLYVWLHQPDGEHFTQK